LFPANGALDYCKNPSSDSVWQVTDGFCRMQEAPVQLSNDEGQLLSVKARIADELSERKAGYQFIGPEVIKHTFILFIFPIEITGAFHMCNVSAPLDIVWIRKDGVILDIQRMEPGPTHTPLGCPSLYAPKTSATYRYALEARAGFFKEMKISACPEAKRGRCKARLIVEMLSFQPN